MRLDLRQNKAYLHVIYELSLLDQLPLACNELLGLLTDSPSLIQKHDSEIEKECR